MSEFGEALRHLRQRRGLSQAGLAAALGGEVSRSTVAGVERGHQAPSPGVWTAIALYLAGEAEQLQPLYEQARAAQEQAETERRRAQRQPRAQATKPEEPADYVFERYDVIYIFEASRSPGEIIELRRLRALTNGAHDFATQFSRNVAQLEVETQVLFGGEITGFDLQNPGGDTTVIMHLVDFQRTLRKGQRHSFGVRYLVERNPELDKQEHVQLASMDYRMEEVGVHLNFWGSEQPARCWAYEGYPHPALTPGAPADGVPVTLNQHNMASAEFRRPVTGTYFGVAWRW